MDDAVRLQYLEAMGIEVWVSRHQPVAVAHATEEQFENVGWAEQSEAHHDNLALSEDIATLDVPERWAALHPAIAPGIALPPASLQSLAQPTFSTSLQPSPTHHHADDHAWHDLQHEVSICRACSLCETRTQTVFGVGNKHADWLLIGEAPGQNEDLQGEPFVGRAGQLLNEMLGAIGLQRQQVYIANMLKCRPPNNRDPQAEEVAACNAFLKQQIALIQPKIILAVGRIAAQNLLHTQQPLSRLRGIRHQLEGIPMIVVHHPAYLLRSLTEKAKAWEDLQLALSVYQSLQQ